MNSGPSLSLGLVSAGRRGRELELPWAAEKVGAAGPDTSMPSLPHKAAWGSGGGVEVESSQAAQLTELDSSGGAGQGEEQGTAPCSAQPVS